MKDGIYNARVDSVQLGYEDHGCLTCWLNLVHQGGYQGFGGYNLMSRAQKEFNATKGDHTGWFIKRVLEICDTDDFIKGLKGQAVRIRLENERIVAIGHIIKEDWFEPRVDWKKDE